MQGLTPGDGNPTPGAPKIGSVPAHLLEYLLYRTLPPVDGQGLRGTDLDTITTNGAPLPVYPGHPFPIGGYGFLGAGGVALATLVTADPGKAQLGGGAHRFRIVAPQAAQGAAFKKYRRPDAGPIVKAETLDIKDQPRDFRQLYTSIT